ncbi:MAG TPA: murein biosynthesis integral membrane protein MurJ [Clostridia bacterium]
MSDPAVHDDFRGNRSSGSSMIRTTSVILAVVILSKVLGMVREMLLASKLGAGIEASAYSVSFSLVYTLTLLFSCFLQTAFLPIYSRARAQSGQIGADRYTSNMLTFFGLAGLAVGTLFYVFAPGIVSVYASGYGPEAQALIVRMTRILIPMFIVQIVSYLLTALLNANEDFVLPNIATMALSFALIPTLLVTQSSDPVRIAVLVTMATSASAVIEVLIQLPTAARRMRYRPILQPRDPLLLQTLMVAVPAVIATGTSEFNQLLQKNLTSHLDVGANAALGYGYKTYAIYIGLLILPVTVILFSRLSARAAENDRQGMLDTLRRYLETMLLVLLPIIALSMLLHKDIIQLLYQRGKFNAADTALTGSALLFFLPGLLGYAVKDIFSRFFFTLQDTRTPMLVGIGSLAVNVGLNLALIGRMGIAGLALASSISLILSGLTLAILLWRKMGSLHLRPFAGQTARIVLASAICAAISAAAVHLLAGRGSLVRLAVAGGIPLTVYIGTVLVLRVTSARRLTVGLLGMIRGRKAS